ncbi:hypothetical protein CEUSTIGMA_g9270.t1 [Chlamydomonas eustigma]|uniref:Protein kinase domain-containing protein n=1 Tax=Chlamydomonas eustigma TaxID=1157962 RepID=A0A250XFZ4_9CHLO|nr:hypothetical protein CEUSTIGMA_g9270.t1 [Chlamydomonas eustigma]|eukprot:GAX81842.1 hypothetical protein CEUSTIGMA_g9270.t1 [Chlamydomonas eustigma]
MERILLQDVEASDTVGDDLLAYSQARPSGLRPSLRPSSQAISQQHPFELQQDVDDARKVTQKTSIRFRESAAAGNKPMSLNDQERVSDKSHMTHTELLKRSVSAIRSSYGAAQAFKTLRDYSSIEIDADQLKFVKRIGHGAFGVVDCCIFKPAQRVVAVKHLKSSAILKNSDELEALKMEIALLRKLHNPHIIEFVGYGSYNSDTESEAEKSLFLVEEFADGGTLKSLISRQMKSIEPLYRMRDAIRWLISIALGLKYLHERQPMVIHRDLKLENILLSGHDPATLQPKIADFGLSALVCHNLQAAVRNATSELPSSPDLCSPDSIQDSAKESSKDNPKLVFVETRALSDNGGDGDRIINAPRRPKAEMRMGEENGKPRERKNSALMAKAWTHNAKRRVSALMLPGMAVGPRPLAGGAAAAAAAAAMNAGLQDYERPSMNLAAEKSMSAKVSQNIKLKVAKEGERLSGRTGTLMYMAPEVYCKQPYNDKADVFSFSIIAYEVLHRYQMICVTNGSLFECQAYARRVARSGFRPPMDEYLPPQLSSLIAKCWSADPTDRPSMAEVVEELSKLHNTLDWNAVEKQFNQQKGLGESDCCSCCVS